MELLLQSATAIPTSDCAFQLGRCIRVLGATVSETSLTLGWNLWVTVPRNLSAVLRCPAWVTEIVVHWCPHTNEPPFVVVRPKGAVEALELKLCQLG